MDEVQTGCGATGTFWAHEQWDLPPGDEPDIVTFSKKMLLGGYYMKPEYSPKEVYPSRIKQVMINYILYNLFHCSLAVQMIELLER